MSENPIKVNEIIDYQNEVSIDFANFTEDINKALLEHDSSADSHANIVSSLLENIDSSANAVTAQIQTKLDLKADLATTSGINTGDETNSTIKSKLGIVSTTNEGYVTPVQKAAWDAASVGGGKTLISGSDTTCDYIGNKLVGGAGINVTKTNSDSNEHLAFTIDSTVTQQGNIFNGINQLVKLNSKGQLPALDGSLLANLIKSDGSVPLMAEQKGVAPTSSTGLTTKAYVQSLISAIDYSSLANITLSNITKASALTNLGFAGQSLTTNGYYKLPNDLILQWGVVYISANTNATFSFPIAFPTACLNIMATGKDSFCSDWWSVIQSASLVSATQFKVSTGMDSSIASFWFAIGY